MEELQDSDFWYKVGDKRPVFRYNKRWSKPGKSEGIRE